MSVTAKTTKLLQCSCTHASQTAMYGDKRVHNLATKLCRPGSTAWRCTVCGSVKWSS